MGKRRRPLQYSSDDDDGDGDNAAPEAPSPTALGSSCGKKQQRRRAPYDEDDLEPVEEGEDENISDDMEMNEEEQAGQEETGTSHRGVRKASRLAEDSDEEEEEDDEGAVPIGDPVKVTVEGNTQRKHYASFEYEGNTYKLEDQVMFVPAQDNEKPYVGIIKDINENDGSLSLSAQWFYRPDEAEKEGGDPRELYYSFHIDEVPADSVMHTCVVHFIPLHKQIPNRRDQPGFIVQQVYDHLEEKLWNISDKDYRDDKQHGIDLLLKKTIDRIGELPDHYPENVPGANPDHFSKLHRRKKPLNVKDASRDVRTGKSEQSINAEMPVDDNLKNYTILAQYKAITGELCRDWFLDKFIDIILEPKVSFGPSHADPGSAAKSLTNGSSVKDTSSVDNENSYAADLVVSIGTSLERSAYEALCADFQKYRQKMRTLLFNIKESSMLRRQLMNKELDPPALLTMTPDELKAGLMPAEKMSETEDSRPLQMTEARCARCTEKKVGIAEIRHANRGDRYQLECISCGYSWHAFRDEISYSETPESSQKITATYVEKHKLIV